MKKKNKSISQLNFSYFIISSIISTILIIIAGCSNNTTEKIEPRDTTSFLRIDTVYPSLLGESGGVFALNL